MLPTLLNRMLYSLTIAAGVSLPPLALEPQEHDVPPKIPEHS